MKLKLYWQILIALVLSAMVAIALKITQAQDSFIGLTLLHTCTFLGKIFMNALKMVVIPLMVSSIISGVMSLGGESNFGRLAIKSVGFYVFSTFAAIIVGVLVINIVKPGYVDICTAKSIIGQVSNGSTSTVIAIAKEYNASEIIDVFLQLIPPNVINAASDERQLLGLIVFSLFFGFFIGKLPEEYKSFQRKL